MVVQGTMSIGEMIMINALLIQMMGPLDHLGANYMNMQQGIVDSREMFDLLDKAEREQKPRGSEKLEVKGGAVHFQDVHFGYKVQGAKEVESHQHVLSGFDLQIPAGKTIAIVGESGCGKSTVARLLAGSVGADRGQVLVDGSNINGVTIESLRDSVAVVEQDASLFNEDLGYNIGYGKKDGTLAETEAAASKAQLMPVIQELENGFNTPVGERGQKLSGGQRQRVSLARALLKDAPILVCDEATSALDVKTEGRLMEALRAERKDKTTVIIAHRLSTITSADQIIVMHNGKVAERGTHGELLQLENGRYLSMWNRQLTDNDSPREIEESTRRREEALAAISEVSSSDDHGHGAGCGCH